MGNLQSTSDGSRPANASSGASAASGNAGTVPLDISIPRYSFSKTLALFPTATVVGLPAPAQMDRAVLSTPYSIMLPVTPSDPRTLVQQGFVDLSYDLVRHDPARGEQTRVIGRKWGVARPKLRYSHIASPSVLTLNLIPVAAALASTVVDKNVSAATSAIKVLFPDTPTNESISMDARQVIASLAGKAFCPERLVWRLATLYCAAVWAEVSGTRLVSATRDIPDASRIGSVGQYNSFLTTTNAIPNVVMFRFDGFADELAPMLSILRLACAQQMGLNLTSGKELPSIAVISPAMGTLRVGYVGPAVGATMLGHITAADVWATATMWCGQHGCMPMMQQFVHLASAMWCSVDESVDGWFQSERIALPMPAFSTASTALTPISHAYVRWNDEGADPRPPAEHAMFHGGAMEALAIGLAIRTWAHDAGMPYLGVLTRASAEGDHIWRQLQRRGAFTPAMFQVQSLLHSFGASGSLGGIACGITPAFTSVSEVTRWWRRPQLAYQWEEVANAVQKLPQCCALLGVIKPLKSKDLLDINRWYGPEVLSESGRSQEEVLQALVYVAGVQLAWRVFNHHDGTATYTEFRRFTNYRGAMSDWMFAPLYKKDYVSARLVFKLTTTADILMVHKGPMGVVEWQWYVTKMVPEDRHDVDTFASPPGSARIAGPAEVRPPPAPVLPPTAVGRPEPSPPAPPDLASNPPSATDPPAALQQVPASAGLKLSTLQKIYSEAGKPVPSWLNSLKLGLANDNTIPASAWTAGSAEGHMRSAWSDVEQLEPNEEFAKLPRDKRFQAASILSGLFAAAAPRAHSISAARGWATESVRMHARATALATCNAVTMSELSDYVDGTWLARTGLDESKLALGLAAGVAADRMVPTHAHTVGDPPVVDPAVIQRLHDAPVQQAQDALESLDVLGREMFGVGAATAAQVEELLGYAPDWLNTPPRSAQPLDPDAPWMAMPEEKPNVAVPIIADPAELSEAPEVLQYAECAGKTIPQIRAWADYADEEFTEDTIKQLDFGNASSTTQLLPPGVPPLDYSNEPEPRILTIDEQFAPTGEISPKIGEYAQAVFH